MLAYNLGKEILRTRKWNNYHFDVTSTKVQGGKKSAYSSAFYFSFGSKMLLSL